MEKAQAKAIEQKHNVFVDAKTEMYTHGDRTDTYGWNIIPEKWLVDLDVVQVQPGRYSAEFTGIDGSGNFCFEEMAENLYAKTKEDAIFKAKIVWGLD